MRYLAVKNFERFQHYKDRRPLWIKFYGAILDDYAFVQLSDAARSHLMLIWQVAANHDNCIPYDAKYIGQAIRSKSRVDLASLIASGFLTEVTKPASNPLAEPEQPASSALAKTEHVASENGARHHARARSRGRGETERETETSSSTARAREGFADEELAERLPSALDRSALTTLLAHVPQPMAWAAEIRASLDGMPGHHVLTPERCGEALRDYVANGAFEHPNLRQFRRYLEQAANEREPATVTASGTRETEWEREKRELREWAEAEQRRIDANG